MSLSPSSFSRTQVIHSLSVKRRREKGQERVICKRRSKKVCQLLRGSVSQSSQNRIVCETASSSLYYYYFGQLYIFDCICTSTTLGHDHPFSTSHGDFVIDDDEGSSLPLRTVLICCCCSLSVWDFAWQYSMHAWKIQHSLYYSTLYHKPPT